MVGQRHTEGVMGSVCWYLEYFGSRHQTGQSRGQRSSEYTSSDERGKGRHHAH